MTTFAETRISESDQENRLSISTSKSQKTAELVQQKNFKEQETRENLENLLKKIYEKENEHPEDSDASLQPSFSKFKLPYSIKCRKRYNDSKKLYEQRFQYEIEQLIGQQVTGYEAARLNGHLCITTIWPPLHSLSEIVHTQRYFFSLTRKERKRLNWIMNTNII